MQLTLPTPPPYSMKTLGRRECPARTGERKCNLRSRRRLPFCLALAANAPAAIHRFIRRPPKQDPLCINMWTNCGSLVRKREIYSQLFSSEMPFFIERTCRADTIAAARESVEASSLARSHPRSFGVADGERGDESSGATRPFGAAPLGLEGAVSSERHPRAGGRAPGRPAPVSDRRRRAFGPPGPSRGAAGPFGDSRSLARKSARKGGGTRRGEPDAADGPAFRRRSPARGIRLLAQAGCLLTGALPRGGKAGSRVARSGQGASAPEASGVSARTHSVGSNLRSWRLTNLRWLASEAPRTRLRGVSFWRVGERFHHGDTEGTETRRARRRIKPICA